MNALDTVNMRGLNDLIRDERRVAETEAKEQGRWVRSRGTYLGTSDKWGQCDPSPSAACYEWHGTRKEIEDLIALVSEKYPDVTMIDICGGYDCADTFEELHGDNYTPWVSAWSFVVWTRE